jgi:alpha-galactosidase
LTIAFSSTSKTATTIAISTSNQTPISHTLPANSKTLTIPLALLASNNNSISISSPLTPSTLTITAPPSTFYPSTAFTLSSSSTLTTCSSGLCSPVGSKIGYLSPSGSGSLSLSSPATGSTTSSKFLNLYFCNNDIAFASSFAAGTNTRNLTLALNGQTPVRVELPLSGRSSELYSPGLGWQDTGVLGVLLEGWLDGVNELVVGNVNGGAGAQSFGADVVGVEIFW